MSWITLTEADVLTKLSAPELTAMKTAATGVGQANPLVEVIEQVVLEVRGYVGASLLVQLGEAGTIPNELLGAAINRIRFELATRLPVPALLTDARKEANKDAVTLLGRVAAGSFLVVAPEDAAPEQPIEPQVGYYGSDEKIGF